MRNDAQSLPVWQHQQRVPVLVRWPRQPVRQRIAQPEQMKPLKVPVPEQ